MPSAPGPAGSLNESQKLHLLTSSQYADKLLSDIESILVAAASKSPFPKYKPDISPAQAKIVEDYIRRIRAQMLRVLAGQGVEPPPARFGSVHSIRVALGFAEIAFEECRPKVMRGYGQLPESAATELNGLVDEMRGLLSKLDAYLAQGEGQDLRQRLAKLEQAGGDIGMVKTIERIVNEHGLVEFRAALSAIVDRLEGGCFEIAVFGRVSSGKSSLLNHIVGSEVLPVGVNPITAVPTRIVYGPAAGATAWFADRSPERFGVERLAEFVTEEHNPANWKHVTRIVVELPSPRLREGVVFVDTPGLGSLATSGAAETRAYLPRCDLGVVLIDAGSTLTQDDLSTIQTLYDAAIPAAVLLSKADLLAPADRERVRAYVAEHIRRDLGPDLPVHPVSVKPAEAHLLDQWLEKEILPLYERHTELARQSLRRKTGALRLGVEAALKARLKRPGITPEDSAPLREAEKDLRTLASRFTVDRDQCIGITDRLRQLGPAALAEAARSAADRRDGGPAGRLVAAALENRAAAEANTVASILEQLARDAARALAGAARALALEDAPGAEEFGGVLKEMPRIDAGAFNVTAGPNPLLMRFAASWAAANLESKLRREIGAQVDAAFLAYGKILEAWVRRAFREMETRFDAHADAYRAQFARLLGEPSGDQVEDEAIQRDLAALNAPQLEGAGIPA